MKLPTTRMRRLSRFSLSMTLLVWMWGPMFTGKIAVSQRFLNAILRLLGGLFQLHRVQLLHHGCGFLPGSFLAFLGVDCLEHLCHQLHLEARHDREHIAVTKTAPRAAESSRSTRCTVACTISPPPHPPAHQQDGGEYQNHDTCRSRHQRQNFMHHR